MATLTTCDKCGTGKDDKTVKTVRVEIPLGSNGDAGETAWIRDLCITHRTQLKQWIYEVNSQEERSR